MTLEEKEYHHIAKFLCDINSKLGQVKLLDSLVSKIATDVDDLSRRINSLDESIKITYEAGMKLENDSNVHIERLDLAALKIGDLIRSHASNALSILELKTRFDNHEINILPRFKEEILMCLEDDEFRISFLKLLFPTADSFDYYTRPLSINHPVDTNKTIDHVPDIGKMVISKLDTAELSVSEDFIVILTMQERMWLREMLKEEIHK